METVRSTVSTLVTVAARNICVLHLVLAFWTNVCYSIRNNKNKGANMKNIEYGYWWHCAACGAENAYGLTSDEAAQYIACLLYTSPSPRD